MVGVRDPAHLTPVKVAVNPPVPVSTLRMNDLPAVAVGIVNVQFPVSVTVWNVPLVSAMVCDVPLLPMPTGESVKSVIVGLVRVLLVSVTVPLSVIKPPDPFAAIPSAVATPVAVNSAVRMFAAAPVPNATVPLIVPLVSASGNPSMDDVRASVTLFPDV